MLRGGGGGTEPDAGRPAEGPFIPYAKEGNEDYHHWLDTVLGEAGLGAPQFTAEVAGPLELLLAVETGIGVSFATRVFASAATGRVKYVSIFPEAPLLQIGCVVHRDRRTDATARLIRELRRLEVTGP